MHARRGSSGPHFCKTKTIGSFAITAWYLKSDELTYDARGGGPCPVPSSARAVPRPVRSPAVRPPTHTVRPCTAVPLAQSRLGVRRVGGGPGPPVGCQCAQGPGTASG